MYLEWFAINGGWEGFFAMWVAGIPYDLTHCGGNFVFTLALYRPLYRVMEKFLGTPAAHEKQISEET
jgi:energy-coupling factor transport system substrate-specific component